ncbi:MAG: ATP-binding cassette domain-containing protein [Chloroflexi bacterium]|nr:ATP-binding cassette domain-containing protein [Chloroflexota bacterium]
MLSVEVQQVTKSFGGRTVVREVSFFVQPGEVLGLVGPNGAGKTTCIRMLLDIIKPDSGQILIGGQPPGQGVLDRIGYLPEERGLYRGLRVQDTVAYLATLKGLPPRKAAAEARATLGKLGMGPHLSKKVAELSRGMAQLVQFAATLVHQPQLVVLDEPFSALDPVNVRLIKDLVRELRKEGTTFVLSTHQMNQVEELCDRVVMINQGQVALNGRLADIKGRFRGNSVLLAAQPYPENVDGVARWEDRGDHRQYFMNDGADPQRLLAQLLASRARVERFELAMPSLEEVFIQVVRSQAA